MTLRNFIAAAAVALGVFAAEAAVNVVPRPVSVEEHDGQFTLTSKTSIGYAEGLEEYAMYLDSILLQSTGYELPVVAGTSKAAIALSIDSAAVGASEGYRLEVGRKRITVVAPTGRPCSTDCRHCCSSSRSRYIPTVRQEMWSGTLHV